MSQLEVEPKSGEDNIDLDESFREVPDGGLKAWLQVGGAFCINLTTWGVINMYGVYQTYYESHLLQHESESNIAWIGSLQGGLIFIVSFVAGPICDAGYFYSSIYLGAFLTVAGMMLTSFCSKYWQLLLAQGLTVGIGSGLLYLPGASIISQYFKNNSGIAFGVASLGSSIGGIIYPVIFRQLQPSIGFGWATRVIAFIQLTALAIPVFGMRQRVPSTTFRQLLDWRLFKEWSFVLVMFGMLFAYMGIYISFFYIELYALSKCGMTLDLASYLLTITNAGSMFGRLVPTYLADKYFGPMNLHAASAIPAAILAFCWIEIESAAGIIVFGVVYGFLSGSLVSLGGPVVFNPVDDLQTVGTCLGMITGMCGTGGLLVGNPIAGAILDHGGWIGLQAWTGSLLLAAGTIILWARIARFGAVFRKKA